MQRFKCNEMTLRGGWVVEFFALAATSRGRKKVGPGACFITRSLPYSRPPGARGALLQSPTLPMANLILIPHSESPKPQSLPATSPLLGAAKAVNSTTQPPCSVLLLSAHRVVGGGGWVAAIKGNDRRPNLIPGS